MKAILMSIRPQHVCNILNGIKTLEIRKKFPKDYVGWVYIYCTKDTKKGLVWDDYGKGIVNNGLFPYAKGCPEHNRLINGKVVARFWCDKVEEIRYHFGYYDMGEWTESYILENACLTAEELDNYLQASKEYDEKKVSRVYGYAIHINKVESFDKPKEISEFKTIQKGGWDLGCFHKGDKGIPLTRAPQSWCYVEE